MTYLVSVYIQDRVYGGPEEGGWWYEEGELVKTIRSFKHEWDAEVYCSRLSRKLKSRVIGPNKCRPSITSVMSDGEYWAMLFEGKPPASFPEDRPHYE